MAALRHDRQKFMFHAAVYCKQTQNSAPRLHKQKLSTTGRSSWGLLSLSLTTKDLGRVALPMVSPLTPEPLG